MKNWRTTLAGILSLIAAGGGIALDPTTASDPQTIGAILAGIGLLTAKDANVTGGKVAQTDEALRRIG